MRQHHPPLSSAAAVGVHARRPESPAHLQGMLRYLGWGGPQRCMDIQAVRRGTYTGHCLAREPMPCRRFAGSYIWHPSLLLSAASPPTPTKPRQEVFARVRLDIFMVMRLGYDLARERWSTSVSLSL